MIQAVIGWAEGLSWFRSYPAEMLARTSSHSSAPMRLVKDNIRIDFRAAGLEDLDGGQILLPNAVLGGHAPLLVELPQVVQVVDAVAHVLPLACRREPHSDKAQGGQTGGVLRRPPPVSAVRREIPFKVLQQCLFYVSLSPYMYFFAGYVIVTIISQATWLLNATDVSMK